MITFFEPIELFDKVPLAANAPQTLHRGQCHSCERTRDIVDKTSKGYLTCSACYDLTRSYYSQDENGKLVKAKNGTDARPRLDGQILFTNGKTVRLWCGASHYAGFNPKVINTRNAIPIMRPNGTQKVDKDGKLMWESRAYQEAFQFISDPKNRRAPYLFVVFKGKQLTRAHDLRVNIDPDFLILSGNIPEPSHAQDTNRYSTVDMREWKALPKGPVGKIDEFIEAHRVQYSTAKFQSIYNGERSLWF